MQHTESRINELFDGLKLLADTAFPKQCPQCAKIYPDLSCFVAETTAVDSTTGLSEVTGDGGSLVSLVRRCSCGIHFSEDCDDRRASDPLGAKRRQLFERLLTLLCDGGMPRHLAKAELLKVMKGENSELLAKHQLAKFFS